MQATTRDTVTMTLRVPAEKFDETLNEIRKTSNRVIVETVKGEDVTEEFIDIEARLKTKKALEEQFLEIMKRSNSVEDALNVQRELAEVRGEIEQIEGRKRFLENQASLSTIKIKLQSPTAFSANSSGFFYQLKESVGSGYNAALNFILVLITVLIALLPFLLLVVLPIYLILRYFWRKREIQNLASEIARDEIKSRVKKWKEFFKFWRQFWLGVALFFLWKGNNDAMFVSTVVGAVCFFLSIRFQVKERMEQREREKTRWK